jgi:hypothetical protein
MSLLTLRTAWFAAMKPHGAVRPASWWRMLFGVAIVTFTIQAWPYLDEQYSRAGLQFVDGLKTKWWSQSAAVHLLNAASIGLATMIAVGVVVPVAAALLWAITMVLLQQNGLSRSPEMSLVHLSLLLLVVVPHRLARWPWQRPREGGLAPMARVIAWAAFAVSYGSAGISKLVYDDSSWIDGSALGHVFNDSVFRRLWYGELFRDRFDVLLRLGTYASLVVEIGTPVLALFHRGRCIAWVTSMTMHLLALLFLNLTEVSVHMLVFHILLVDDRMIADGHHMLQRIARITLEVCQWCQSTVRGVVVVDVRAVVLFRQAIGLMAAADAIQRVQEAPLFLSNSGWQGGTSAIMDMPYVYGWLVLEFVAGIALLLGRRPLIAGVVLYAVLAVIIQRQHFAATGGDTMMIMATVWMVVLGATTRRPLTVVPVLAYMIYLVMVYGTSVWFKLQHEVWRDGRASCLALLADDYAQAPALWLRPLCSAGGVFHWSVLAVEAMAPVLMVVLVLRRRHPRLQALLLIAVVAMHLGFAITLNVWLFSLASCVLWIPFVPAAVFDRLHPRRPRPIATRPRVPVLRIMATWSLLAVLTGIIGMGLANQKRPRAVVMMGIDQRWRMFSRDRWDVQWMVVPVLLADGSVVDARRRGLPVSWAKPANLASTFPTMRELSFWRWMMNDRANTEKLAKSICSNSPLLPAGSKPVRVKVVRMRQPMDMSALRLRNQIATEVVADVSCANTRSTFPGRVWPSWTTPPKRLQLGGEALPFSTKKQQDKNLPRPPAAGRVNQ